MSGNLPKSLLNNSDMIGETRNEVKEMGHDSAGQLSFILGSLVGLIVLYVYAGVTFSTIAKKTDTQDPWLAWVPIGNLILLARIAQKPFWWALLIPVPIIGFVFQVLLFMKVAERRNFPGWYGVLIIVPIINLMLIGYLAFADRSA